MIRALSLAKAPAGRAVLAPAARLLSSQAPDRKAVMPDPTFDATTVDPTLLEANPDDATNNEAFKAAMVDVVRDPDLLPADHAKAFYDTGLRRYEIPQHLPNYNRPTEPYFSQELKKEFSRIEALDAANRALIAPTEVEALFQKYGFSNFRQGVEALNLRNFQPANPTASESFLLQAIQLAAHPHFATDNAEAEFPSLPVGIFQALNKQFYQREVALGRAAPYSSLNIPAPENDALEGFLNRSEITLDTFTARLRRMLGQHNIHMSQEDLQRIVSPVVASELGLRGVIDSLAHPTRRRLANGPTEEAVKQVVDSVLRLQASQSTDLVVRSDIDRRIRKSRYIEEDPSLQSDDEGVPVFAGEVYTEAARSTGTLDRTLTASEVERLIREAIDRKEPHLQEGSRYHNDKLLAMYFSNKHRNNRLVRQYIDSYVHDPPRVMSTDEYAQAVLGFNPGTFAYALERLGFNYYMVNERSTAVMTKTGRVNTFCNHIAVGNRKGAIGFASGSHQDSEASMLRATIRAHRRIDTVPINVQGGYTLFHPVFTKFCATKIYIWPRPRGFGIRGNATSENILRMAGIDNATVKIHGSRNPINVAYATIQALKLQVDPALLRDD